MKTRLISWLFLGFLLIVVIAMGLFARKSSTEARVEIEWSTASELDTVGFNIFRSENETDPGIQVNSELIPASQDAQAGANYQFTDAHVIPGKVYYYYLEDVSSDGILRKHGPVTVKAESSGLLEWGLTGAFALIILLGIIILVWPKRKTG